MRCYCVENTHVEFYVSNSPDKIDSSAVSDIVKVGDTSLTSSNTLYECD